jgi:hypothetical protein
MGKRAKVNHRAVSITRTQFIGAINPIQTFAKTKLPTKIK